SGGAGQEGGQHVRRRVAGGSGRRRALADRLAVDDDGAAQLAGALDGHRHGAHRSRDDRWRIGDGRRARRRWWWRRPPARAPAAEPAASADAAAADHRPARRARVGQRLRFVDFLADDFFAGAFVLAVDFFFAAAVFFAVVLFLAAFLAVDFLAAFLPVDF